MERSNSRCDATALFASGIERLKAAQKELTLAQRNMEDIRRRIRSSGNYEPDSLLYLCDGDDNHILSYIMKYLTIEDVGRCEIVCQTLKLQAKHYWDMKLIDANLNNHPTLRSPSAKCSRDVVIRYQLASSLAKRIGDMKDSISKHLVVKDFNRYERTISDERVDDHCKGCNFPDLNFDPLRRETRDEYELFVRFCRTSDSTLLAEGFLPYDSDMDDIKLQLRNEDFTNWPQLVELTRLIETCEEDTFATNRQYNNMLDACMRELTAVVVGVKKNNSEASLVIAQSNFGQTPNNDYDSGIDNMGDHGFCWPKGCMSAKSHGKVETKEVNYTPMGPSDDYHSDITHYDNQHCDARLGMLFQNCEWTNRESGKVVKVECQWVLNCSCDNITGSKLQSTT